MTLPFRSDFFSNFKATSANATALDNVHTQDGDDFCASTIQVPPPVLIELKIPNFSSGPARRKIRQAVNTWSHLQSIAKAYKPYFFKDPS